ncbi:ArsR/SmtB family transcription factor, partial [Candidatus Protofrankia californiensis]|uniref:ArsR/SmtB family transcription factor n=1 Tax=Candidatus Protofrankia californiensis TaxID=1839754 RepID=UPI001F4965AD
MIDNVGVPDPTTRRAPRAERRHVGPSAATRRRSVVVGTRQGGVRRGTAALSGTAATTRTTDSRILLDNFSFRMHHEPMLDVAVIEDPAAAEVSLDPVRARLLAALAEPGSATTLAAQTGLTRQKINYHLRTLEQHGLVELVEERRKGNCTERVLRATASSYVISPAALADVAPDPDRARDETSARWMLALASRLIKEV